MSKVYMLSYTTGYNYISRYSVDADTYIKVCVVVVYQLVHTVEYTVVGMIV